MPADILPGNQRILDGDSTTAADVGASAHSTSAAALAVWPKDNRPAAITVRASTDYNTSTTTTNTADAVAYGGAIGMVVYVDQTVVDASSAGGGTGSMTHTIQYKDPIGGTYVNTTGVITATTAVATFIAQCYPGMGTVAPTSAAVGKYDLAAPNVWRIASASASSATNRTYSIAAQYLPTSASSS